MSDIVQEVEEDLRRERYVSLWKRYGWPSVGALGAALLVAGGVVAWNSHQKSLAREASLKYQEMIAPGEGPPKAPEERLKALEGAKKLSGGYALIARMARASALVDANKMAEAVKELDAIADDSAVEQSLRDVARIKSLLLQADSLSFADLKSRLGKLAAPESAFRFTAQELLGYTAFRAGDLSAAQSAYQTILSDLAAPADIRQRATDMLDEVEQRLPPGAKAASKPALKSAEKSAAPRKTP